MPSPLLRLTEYVWATWTRRLLLGVFLLLVVLAVALGYTTCSAGGLRWLVGKLTPYLPGELTIGHLRGCLIDEVTLTDLRFQNADQAVRVDNAIVGWDPWRLLTGTLYLNPVRLDGLHVQRIRQKPPNKEPFKSPQLPVALEIAGFQLRNASFLTAPDKPATAIDKLTGHARLNASEVILDHLIYEQAGIKTEVSGEVVLRDKFPLKLIGKWEIKPPHQWLSQGSLSVEGTLKRYKINLSGTAANKDLAPIKVTLGGYGTARKLVIQKLDSALLDGKLMARGKVDWAKKLPEVEVSGKWEGLKWKQGEKVTWQSEKGDFELTGNLEHYQVMIDGQLLGTQIPPGRWGLAGVGEHKHFRIAALDGELLGGRIQLAGMIDWKKELNWELAMRGDGLNPGLYWEKWPGKLALQLDTTGVVKDGKLNAVLKKNSLIVGQLRGYPFATRADAEIKDEVLLLKTLEIRSSASRLQLTGQAAKEQLDLRWLLNSPDLVAIYPQARGRLQGTGTIAGKPTEPRLTLELKGTNVALAERGAGTLTMQATLDRERNSTFKLNLNAHALRLGQAQFDTLALSGGGDLSGHQARLTLTAPEQLLQFTLQGGWTDNRWSGSLASGSLQDARLGRWAMTEPTTITANAEAARMEQLCWSNAAKGRLCLGGDWDKSKGWHAHSQVRELPLALLRPYIPATMSIDGMAINSDLQAMGSAGRVAEVRGEVRAAAGMFTVLREEEEPILFKLNPSLIKLNLGKTGGEAEALVSLAEPGATPLHAHVILPPLEPVIAHPENLAIKGELTGAFTNLALVDSLVPEVDRVQGQIAINLTLAGTLGKPLIGGQVNLQNGAFDLPALNVGFEDITIEATGLADQPLAIKGRARSGKGQLTAIGTINLVTLESPVRLQVQGENFEVVNLPEYWVQASPNLQIRAGKSGVTIDGEVRIPEARVEPGLMQSRITVSPDVVIIPEPGGKSRAKHNDNVHARVRVTLGDKVRLVDSRFKARLEGSLLMFAEPPTPPTGSGVFQILDGIASVYGQKLTINEGQVIFAGGPLDDPGVNIKAYREITRDNVQAGVRIAGRASEPMIDLYSTPTMNQDEILAYLLFGQPLSSVSGNKATLLLQAVSSLGSEKSGMLTQKIAKTFGLDQFGLAEGSSPDQFGFAAGKYLTPRLYVNYTAGLLEPMGVLKARYELTKSWLLQVETGARTGVDLLYSIEGN